MVSSIVLSKCCCCSVRCIKSIAELHPFPPERMIELLERGLMYTPLDICVDARAVCDAIRAPDACEFAGSSLKFHLVSVRDGMTYGQVRKLSWVDARDLLADGLVK